ncbi:hypothetical protein [Vibrio phage vB_VpaP_G1]|uniref:Uncharacterized protein n=1 Tax=Vibrio phage vB_VpaP_G1 TaxID=2862773 RepID=A0AAE7WU36_9CAUD|nr:hypothetical protein PP280_gp41 [Vibrio phage vB_VpaP_G1]QYW05841.1 hypothetical protein [Vibrio phage vB_VpaP_G1]
MVSIRGKSVQETTVQVTEQDIFFAALECLSPKDAMACTVRAYKREWGLPAGAYLKGTNWVKDEEHYTSHSWSTTEVIREATESEIEVYNTLINLYNK